MYDAETEYFQSESSQMGTLLKVRRKKEKRERKQKCAVSFFPFFFFLNQKTQKKNCTVLFEPRVTKVSCRLKIT